MDTLKDKHTLDALVESGERAVGGLGEPRRAQTLAPRPARQADARRCDWIAAPRAGPLTILALGAHADDIEIGCGGTLLRLAESHPDVDRALGRAERR